MNAPLNPQDIYADEVFLSARKRANRAHLVSLFCLAIAGLSMIGWIMVLPLKQTKPYVIFTNSETGATQRMVDVEAMNLTEEEAVVQANVVRYVLDRETYDAYDNSERIRNVLKLSDGQASTDLKDIWSRPDDNPNHPDVQYGKAVRVHVEITGVTLLDNNIAQVFVNRTRKQRNVLDVTSRSLITLQFKFEPSAIRKVEDVWDNPLGFKVTDYRIDLQSAG
jgi:type IV secretion system protein VirB8